MRPQPLSCAGMEHAKPEPGSGGDLTSVGRAEWDPWWLAARLTAGSLFHAAFRLRIEGWAGIPARGGALLTYNHVSVLDPIPVALVVARRGRPVRFMALSELFEHGVVGWGLRVTKQIPLRRGLGDWAAVERVADVLRTGSLAAMSPEGTVGEGPALQPGQRGAARIALAAGVPIVPVGVWGTQRRWPRTGLHWKGPARPIVGVSVGPPIPSTGRPRVRADVLALTERMMAELQVAVDRARRLGGRTDIAGRPG
jgi:1-acyl-sn-glycerol-3-phosphate acyltransferase